jgi:hypothetical protein
LIKVQEADVHVSVFYPLMLSSKRIAGLLCFA